MWFGVRRSLAWHVNLSQLRMMRSFFCCLEFTNTAGCRNRAFVSGVCVYVSKRVGVRMYSLFVGRKSYSEEDML
ncbi:hypothetical protein DFH27DRAFT_567467 [Peziza echinospora]|nr:hypothetical protein DFH27DRAFT_567467 [Peziza echinospora]